MKTYHLSKNSLFFFTALFLSLQLLTSCSWLSFGGDDDEPETVSKEQFDQLLKKYESLKKRETITSAQRNAQSEMGDLNLIEKDSQEILQKLQRVNTPGSKSTSTVKLGTGSSKSIARPSIRLNRPSAQSRMKPKIESAEYSTQMVEAQIKEIRKAESFIVQGRFPEALKIVKSLERSPIKQIAVRAKFLLGESFFRQGEFDLAMQVYEDLINKYSFSGLIIKSLGRLIVCSEKLNIPSKKEQYYSILHDFFEQG